MSRARFGFCLLVAAALFFAASASAATAPSNVQAKQFVRGWAEDYSQDRFRSFCRKLHVSFRRKNYGAGALSICVSRYAVGLGPTPYAILGSRRVKDRVRVRIRIDAFRGYIHVGRAPNGRLYVYNVTE